MIKARIHRRGGLGAVTSAGIPTVTAIREGRYAQDFPGYGPYHEGAPVAASCTPRTYELLSQAS